MSSGLKPLKRIRILETCTLFTFVVELVWFKQVLIKPEYFQITVMTISAFTKFLHSAVQIYGIHIFIISFSTFPGVLWTNFNDKLPLCILHNSLERCAGIAKVRVRILASLNFFRPPFLNCISYVFNFDDHFSIYFFIMQSKYMVFINSLFHHIKYVVLNHTHFTLTSWKYLLDLRITCYVWICDQKNLQTIQRHDFGITKENSNMRVITDFMEIHFLVVLTVRK